MENVQFDGDSFQRPKSQYQSNSSGNGSFLTRMAMKLGAKDETQAQVVLFGIAILAFVLMVIVIVTQFTSVGKKTVNVPPNMSEIMYPPKDI